MMTQLKKMALSIALAVFLFSWQNVQAGSAINLSPLSGSSCGVIEDDAHLVLRLVQAYQLSDSEMNRGSAIWHHIFHEKHQNIHHIFKTGQYELAAQILRNPAGTDLFYGIDNLCHSFLFQALDPTSVYGAAINCIDGLARFAAAIGVLRLDNPEWNQQPIFSYEAESILRLIEQKLNCSLSFPNPYPYEYGLSTSKGIISYRVPQALYQAWKIKELVKDIKNPRVLEIGGGLGRTAYYASLLGIKDYTIIDIPLTAICSGYFLGRALGEENVVLHGEKIGDSENKIKILTPSDFLNDVSSYDLIINVDSMTEMSVEMAHSYLKKIEQSTKIFLSINHEINEFTMSNLLTESPSVLAMTRYPYWMRHGYVEELVLFK